MKQTAVNLEFRYQKQVFDLRVPSRVSLARLEQLLAPILAAQQVALPPKWHLRLRDKTLLLDSAVPLNHYPIANGDRFDIEPEEAQPSE